MKQPQDYLDELTRRYPALAPAKPLVSDACELLAAIAEQGGKILLCGNGGSCADCEHIAGELLKGFLSRRELRKEDLANFSGYDNGEELAKKLQYGICAIPLPSLSSVFTAFCSDVDPAAVYAQLVYAIGRSGDALICISTSGNADNICQAAIAAKAAGIKVVGLTGESGGRLAPLCDVCIRVPGTETYKIQELHLPVYHAVCAYLEAALFGDGR